jgi:lon-related putative ATP-dependent protease
MSAEPRLVRRKIKELSSRDVYRPAAIDALEFETTADLELLTGVIEQDRAVKALELGLRIDKRNYNIYVAGESGTGKTTLVKTLLNRQAPRRPTPEDWICVHNFKDPSMPRSVSIPPGTGGTLKRELAEVITGLRESIPKVFHSKEHQEKVQGILNDSLDRENDCFVDLSKEASEVGFTIKSTKTGIVTIPMVDDKVISNKDYAHLTEEERRRIEENRKKLDPHISEFLQRTRDIELGTHGRIQEIQQELGDSVAGVHFERLLKRHSHNEKVAQYLEAMFKDIVENLSKFLPDESDPAEAREALKKPLKEYEVNVLVDNLEVEGAPVIFETRPTYSNLFGKIERRVENGVYFTDFTMIRSGSLLKASGGYLILNVLDLFQQPGVWDQLKSCLRNKEVAIEDPGFLSPFLPTTGLKPEAVPIHPKIILLGSAWAYYMLYRGDEDFRKNFQVLCDFDDEIDQTRRTVREYAQFIATTCKNDGLLPVDRDGVAKVVEYGARMAGSKRRLTLKFNDIANLVIEANYFAERKRAKVITRQHVKDALRARRHRNALIEDKLQREIMEGRQLVDTTGEAVGQINGLAVYSLGELSFGKPSRITANTFAGKSGIVNIEREAKMSGRSHDKGIYIIDGYLGMMYAQDAPLSLSITICFEQSYSGVDGDSASSTELYAIMSSLSGLPIKQGIAVTGSVNQKGEIQPIGGVNEKVEGFFEVCKARKLTGDQGVIIPHQNVANLMLGVEVRAAVAEGNFHIWPVRTIEEGIEVLTGVQAGKRGKSGKFPKGTVHSMVLAQLGVYSDAGRPKKSGKAG